jgi:hypothetical protein
MEALTVDVLAIAAAAAWLLVFGWCSAVTRRPALRAGAADPGPGLAPAKPALVNLSVTQGRLNGAAYPATILDLAAGGYLTISERGPGQLWCDVPPFSPPGTGLARSERLVLTGAWALAGGRGAPFEALADSHASDARGRWDPFERAVRAEGRRAGVTRPRLPAAARLLLYAGAGAVAASAFAAVYGRSHSGLWAPSVAAFFAFAVLASWARSVGRQDRLTAYGSALGAWAARAAGDMTPGDITAGDMAATGGTPGLGPAELSRLAWAVAVGAPVPIPGASRGLAAGIRPGRGRAADRAGRSGPPNGPARPSSAWSSFGGQWRLVRIGPASFMRIHPAFWLVLAAWLALMAYVSSLLPAPAGLLVPAGLAVGSAAAAVGGVRGLAARLARPAEASFRAQVIARWVEHTGTSDDDYISCIAVDDGERSWSFDVGGEALGQLALGDTVAVRASPRSGRLLGLTPDRDQAPGAGPPGATTPGEPAASSEPAAAIGKPAAAAGEPSGVAAAGDGKDAMRPGARWAQRNGTADAPPPSALLSADEVSAAVGRPVRRTAFTPGAASVVYRGEGITVIVTVADGFLGSLTAMAQRRGQLLAGIGDGAWLLNRGRTAVLLVGGLTAKVTAGGSATRSLPPDAVTRLAATVAERLPRPAPLPCRGDRLSPDRRPGRPEKA